MGWDSLFSGEWILKAGERNHDSCEMSGLTSPDTGSQGFSSYLHQRGFTVWQENRDNFKLKLSMLDISSDCPTLEVENIKQGRCSFAALMKSFSKTSILTELWMGRVWGPGRVSAASLLPSCINDIPTKTDISNEDSKVYNGWKSCFFGCNFSHLTTGCSAHPSDPSTSE